MIFVSDFSQLRKQRCLQLLKHAPSTQHVQKNTCPHIFRNSGSSATCSSSNTPPARSTCTKHVSTRVFLVLGAALPAAPQTRPQHAARAQNTCPHFFSQFWEQRYLQLLKHAPSTQHVHKTRVHTFFRSSGSSATCSSFSTPPARSTYTKHMSTRFFAVLGAALPAAPQTRPQHAARAAVATCHRIHSAVCPSCCVPRLLYCGCTHPAQHDIRKGAWICIGPAQRYDATLADGACLCELLGCGAEGMCRCWFFPAQFQR